MNKYVDPQYIINELCYEFHDKLGITLNDVYETIQRAPGIIAPNLAGCNCKNCLYVYDIITEKETKRKQEFYCDCTYSIMYGKKVSPFDVCTEWESE